jgi:hypothetical protein
MLGAPLRAADRSVSGGIIIVYDTGYIRAEIFRVWSRVFVHIAGLVLVIVAITLLIVRWSLAGPIARAAEWMNTLRTARHSVQVPARDLEFFQPLAREMAPLAESMRQARAAAEIEARLRNTNESLWTAERLADHVRTKLDGSSPHCGLQSGALCSQPAGQHGNGHSAGQWPGDGPRADTLRLQRDLGR